MALEAVTIVYELGTWLRAVRDDTRLSPDVKDLAYQMAFAANAAGYCSATNPQLRQHLRGDRGKLVPDTTLRNRRRKLAKCGYVELVKRGGYGVGRGYGSVYRLLLPVELRPSTWAKKASKEGVGKRPLNGRHAHANGTELATIDSLPSPEGDARDTLDDGALVDYLGAVYLQTPVGPSLPTAAGSKTDAFAADDNEQRHLAEAGAVHMAASVEGEATVDAVTQRPQPAAELLARLAKFERRAQ